VKIVSHEVTTYKVDDALPVYSCASQNNDAKTKLKVFERKYMPPLMRITNELDITTNYTDYMMNLT
jgi:hypothetical protein